MVGRVVAAVAVVVAVVAGIGPVAPAGAREPSGAAPGDRYLAAGGCYRVRAVDGTGAGRSDLEGPLRFVATDLGRYLLVRPDGTFLVADEGRAVRSRNPSPRAEWDLGGPPEARSFSLVSAASRRALVISADGSLRLEGAGSPTALALEATPGCHPWPEVDTGVTGPIATGDSPIGEVRGYLDSHLHITAFEFVGGRLHCGRPWHPYGVAHALVDCPDHVATGGTGAVVENLLGGGTPIGPHDTTGWPTFRDWPAPRSLTHEQTYHRWLERAWRGGTRLIVNLLVENRVLCELYPLKQNPCDEMASVRLQAVRIRELERYIDAQHGGPGRGWLRIVDDPEAARRVINDGKLAVVLGIEISEPFGCRAVLDQPLCSTSTIDAGLDELAALGVRQIFPVHKFDNALGGVKGDGGMSGLFTNPGNLLATGHLIAMRTCSPDAVARADNGQTPAVDHDHGGDVIDAMLGSLSPVVVPPVYPPTPHCNVRGLTDLGAHALDAMADRGLIVDVDHMSGAARDAALDRLEARRYSGVVSSHSWADDPSLPRILALGGVVAPYAGDSTSFLRAWRALRPLAAPGFAFGTGYGADSNGLGSQGSPRGGPNPVRYPFTGFGGTTIDRQVSGERTFDVNVDGVAHYGLYPDWIEDVRLLAGEDGGLVVADLERGPEAYLQMWERASGVPRFGDGCLAPGAPDAIGPGATASEVLRRAGQPQRRTGTAFVYCDGEVRFDAQGRAVEARSGGPTVAARSIAATLWQTVRTLGR